MRRGGRLALLVVATVALGAGFWLHPWNRGAPPSSVDVTRLLAASLPDMDGKSQALKQWQGKVMIVNFWATWCSPCLEEIPEFVRMQERFGNQGVQFVGIAVDNVAKVREFAVKYHMNYPVLIGEIEAIELARSAGNEFGALPFSVVIDRKGRLIGTELGGLNEEKLIALIKPAI